MFPQGPLRADFSIELSFPRLLDQFRLNEGYTEAEMDQNIRGTETVLGFKNIGHIGERFVLVYVKSLDERPGGVPLLVSDITFGNCETGIDARDVHIERVMGQDLKEGKQKA